MADNTRVGDVRPYPGINRHDRDEQRRRRQDRIGRRPPARREPGTRSGDDGEGGAGGLVDDYA